MEKQHMDKAQEQALMDAELYTCKLNDMAAKIAIYIQNHPQCQNKDKLGNMRERLSLAHHDSRFYHDEDHFQQWAQLLKEAEALLIGDKIQNVLQ